MAKTIKIDGRELTIVKEEIKQSPQYNLSGIMSDFSKGLKIEDIPTLIPQKAMTALTDGDDKPFMFLVEVKIGEKFPATDGSIYTDQWAESYLAGMKLAPYPGSGNGHTAMNAWGETVDNHTYVIGGQKTSGDSMVLKHYIPSEHKTLIKEVKAGMKTTSVMDWHNVAYIEEEDGFQEYVLDTVRGQRNDIIEHDLGGMATAIVSTSQKADNKTIEGENDMAKDKVPYEDALLAIQSQKSVAGFSSQKLGEDLGGILGFTVLGVGQVAISTSQKEKLEKIEEFEKTSQKDVLLVVKELNADFEKDFENHKAQKIKEACKDFPEGVESAVSFYLDDVKTGQKDELETSIKKALDSKYVKDIAGTEMDTANRSSQKGIGSTGKEPKKRTYSA